MAYSFQTFSLNQILTSAQMNQVEVNIRDHVHGVAGVVALASSNIAGLVDQAALKSTTASGNTTLNSGTNAGVALTGGTYSWWTVTIWNNAGGAGVAGNAWGAPNTAVQSGTPYFFNGSVGNSTISRSERYIQASPPYNFGPLFVFLIMNADGSIDSIDVAPDPTWAYHGPTNITPEKIDPKTGKTYRRVRTYDGRTLDAVKKNDSLLRAVLLGEVEPVEQDVELTLDYKDSDMNVAPHPWYVNAPDSPLLLGKTVVLLEPGTSLMQRLEKILQDGHAADVVNMIQNDYLAISNDPLELDKCPAGVMVVRAALKNAKSGATQ